MQLQKKLYEVISSHMTKQPNCIFIEAGHFDQIDLRTVLPKFHKHVHNPIKRNNTMGHVYTNIPHFGQSDHISLLLLPTYTQLINRVKP